MQNFLNTLSDSEITPLLQRLKEAWESGECCPKKCHTVNGNPPCHRLEDGIKVASFAVHDGEEPPVSGWNGAGNVFFSGCNLGCVFCQNWPISHNNNGNIYQKTIFMQKLRDLLGKGVHNLNFVTPDHYVFPLVDALISMRREISVPLVWNCSGYFELKILQSIRKVADIFLLDVKYADSALAKRCSNVVDYPAKIADVLHDFSVRPLPWIEDDVGILKQGLIIRHLVLPGSIQNSLDVMDMLEREREQGLDFKISLMNQYFPAFKALKMDGLSRKVTDEEYQQVVKRAEKYEFDGWIQSE